jgi:hypothetical protein
VARTTCFAVGAGDTAPKGVVRFSSKIAPVQDLSFGSLDYVTDHSGELHLFEGTSSEDNESLALDLYRAF